MSTNFKETIRRLLTATNYSLDNLSLDDISSFDNLPHIKPLLEWLSQSVSEANCVTPEELEEFNRLKLNNKVKYGDELEEAVQSHLDTDGESSIPFEESLNDAGQELTLLKEQLYYKQALYQSLSSSNAAASDDISELNKMIQRAETEQREAIKKICSTNKILQEKYSQLKANVDEVHDDIIALAKNDDSPKASSDEEISVVYSAKTNLNKSLSTSVWSLATSSSWRTIRGNDENINYMCQLSFDKYQQIHRHFLKRLTKLLKNLSEVGRSQNNGSDYMELHNIKETLENQIFTMIERDAELEAIRAARDKVKELRKTLSTEECPMTRLMEEVEEVENSIYEGSFGLIDKEELATACRQWAECKTLQAVEYTMRERLESSKSLVEKMDEIMKPLILKLNADKVLREVLLFEMDKVKTSMSLYKSFYQSQQTQYNQIQEQIETMKNNLQDFNQFCTLPLEERNDLVGQLASIILCDKAGLVQAIQNLTESSRSEHETIYQHYVQEKNKFISSGETMEETCKMAMSHCVSTDGVSSDVIDNIQRGLDQLECGIEEANNSIREILR